MSVVKNIEICDMKESSWDALSKTNIPRKKSLQEKYISDDNGGEARAQAIIHEEQLEAEQEKLKLDSNPEHDSKIESLKQGINEELYNVKEEEQTIYLETGVVNTKKNKWNVILEGLKSLFMDTEENLVLLGHTLRYKKSAKLSLIWERLFSAEKFQERIRNEEIIQSLQRQANAAQLKLDMNHEKMTFKSADNLQSFMRQQMLLQQQQAQQAMKEEQQQKLIGSRSQVLSEVAAKQANIQEQQKQEYMRSQGQQIESRTMSMNSNSAAESTRTATSVSRLNLDNVFLQKNALHMSSMLGAMQERGALLSMRVDQQSIAAQNAMNSRIALSSSAAHSNNALLAGAIQHNFSQNHHVMLSQQKSGLGVEAGLLAGGALMSWLVVRVVDGVQAAKGIIQDAAGTLSRAISRDPAKDNTAQQKPNNSQNANDNSRIIQQRQDQNVQQQQERQREVSVSQNIRQHNEGMGTSLFGMWPAQIMSIQYLVFSNISLSAQGVTSVVVISNQSPFSYVDNPIIHSHESAHSKGSCNDKITNYNSTSWVGKEDVRQQEAMDNVHNHGAGAGW